MSGIVGSNLGRGSGLVKAGSVGADSVTGASIADDAIDSEHYVNASIDNAHLADDAVGLAEMASGTDGNVISYDASGNPVAISTGSDGQVLTSTGAGSPPAFEAAAAGGKIGQVVSVTSTTNVNMAVSSYTEISSSLRLSITPSATTSKILYFFATTIRNVDSGNGAFFDLFVDVAGAGYNSTSGGDILKYTSYGMGANTYNNVAWSFYHQPSTTSALIYSPYYKGANTSVVGMGDSAYIQTWAMEILA